jgi:hypothetical protein
VVGGAFVRRLRLAGAPPRRHGSRRRYYDVLDVGLGLGEGARGREGRAGVGLVAGEVAAGEHPPVTRPRVSVKAGRTVCDPGPGCL